MKEYNYKPHGVCSSNIKLIVNGDILEDIEVIGGCNGNLKGIRSLVQGMKLVDVKENKVFVSLKGMCKSCKFSSNTLKNFVEASLKEHISADIEVVEV